MIYLFLVGILILLVIWVLKGISTFLYNLLTLSFLPDALGMFDGNVASYTIPIVGQTLGIVVNYLVAAFINLIDFCIWFINWIPGLNLIIKTVYTSPDMVERMLPFIFGGQSGHRNFITHSVLNPVFLVFLIITFILTKLLSKTRIRDGVIGIASLIGLTFVCHLLADTMPQSWIGFANIKFYLFIKLFTLPPLLSKLWLYVNAVLSLGALRYVTGFGLETEEESSYSE